MKPTIRNKLTGGFAGVLALMAVVAAIGGYAVFSLRKSAYDATRVGARLNSLALEIQVHNLEAERRVRSYLNHSKTVSDKTREGYLEETSFEIHEIQSLASTAMKIAPNDAMRSKFQGVSEAASRYEQALKMAVEADKNAPGSERAQAALAAYEDVAESLHESAEDGESSGHDAAQASLEAIDSIGDRSVYMVVGISAVGLLFGAFVSFRLGKAILVPVDHLKDVAENVSLGNLEMAVRRYSEDEIGDLADSFSRMVTAVKFFRLEAEAVAAEHAAAELVGGVK